MGGCAQRRNDGRCLPHEVATILDEMSDLKNARLLFGVPEHKVALDTARAPSQTDIWGLLRNDSGLLSLGVEGKAGEPFDVAVRDWLTPEISPTRLSRLKWLCNQLKTDDQVEKCAGLRYQLFHRTASTIKEAKRCGAFAAVLLVQAFPGAEASWEDFYQFCSYLGGGPKKEHLLKIESHTRPDLYVGWVSSKLATDAEIVAAEVTT